MNMNEQHVTMLILLDLSAAFAGIDHGILVDHLCSKLGVKDDALAWFSSYLTNRSQRVSACKWWIVYNKFNGVSHKDPALVL